MYVCAYLIFRQKFYEMVWAKSVVFILVLLTCFLLLTKPRKLDLVTKKIVIYYYPPSLSDCYFN